MAKLNIPKIIVIVGHNVALLVQATFVFPWIYNHESINVWLMPVAMFAALMIMATPILGSVAVLLLVKFGIDAPSAYMSWTPILSLALVFVMALRYGDRAFGKPRISVRR
ncbi:hypothetical protein [Vibrio sp.]|uniref:hypothetical protein n=1 Tax=Vibrio sp. TaxID=678 RepID=UPI003D0B7C1F